MEGGGYSSAYDWWRTGIVVVANEASVVAVVVGGGKVAVAAAMLAVVSGTMDDTTEERDKFSISVVIFRNCRGVVCNKDAISSSDMPNSCGPVTGEGGRGGGIGI